MRRLIVVAAVAVALAGLAAEASAQQGRAGVRARQEAAQAQARQQRIIAEQKAALAKQQQDQRIAEGRAAQQARIDAIKAQAAAENRALTPDEEGLIAQISARMEARQEMREAMLAEAKEERQDRLRDAQRRRDRERTMREDRCRLAGNHQNRIDRPKGVGC